MAPTPQESASKPRSPTERVLVAIATHRMGAWLWVSIALLAVVLYFARHMAGVEAFGLLKLTVAVYVGYIASLAVEGCLKHGDDRAPRPHEYRQDAGQWFQRNDFEQWWRFEQIAAAMLWRRAMIVSACIIASSLGG